MMSLYPELLTYDSLPSLNLQVQAFFRVVAGVLFLYHHILMLPIFKFYYRKKSVGGYHDEIGLQKYLGKYAHFVIGSVWFALTLMIIFNQYVVIASLVNLVLAYFFYIRLRWRSLARGMGAPGFMYFWLSACIFLLELSTQYAFSARPYVILMFQLDFAIIMLSAGIYKATSGYISNNGMELGMINPEWGYWGKTYKNIPPQSIFYQFLNQCAWFFEILGAILMFIPQTRLIGSLMIAGSFLFVATQIRLGNLCFIVISCSFLFLHEGSLFSQWIVNSQFSNEVVMSDNLLLAQVLISLSVIYMILRPIVLSMLYYNFYLHKKFPAVVQKLLELYTNTFGIILWRVFTIDIVNFFPEVYVLKDGKRIKISDYSNPLSGRFNQVTESITLTTIFTALKYFPHNFEIFKSRILDYSKTISKDHPVVFEYYRVLKSDTGFYFKLCAEYTVANGEVLEKVLEPSLDPRVTATVAASHSCTKPGSYATA